MNDITRVHTGDVRRLNLECVQGIFGSTLLCNIRNEAKVRDFEASIELTTGKAKCMQSLLVKENYSNMDYNANWQRFLSCLMTNAKMSR